MDNTYLSAQEIQWILEKNTNRLTDDQELLIYPMGAERYLHSVLSHQAKNRYPIHTEIHHKHILALPGYANNAFILAQAGAKKVTAYDKDPITVAWLKAFKKYYYYREPNSPSVGELLDALTAWYPPYLILPQRRYVHRFLWMLHPQELRRSYLLYLVSLICKALQCTHQKNMELEKDIQFHVGGIETLSTQKKRCFDTAYVPYLLGVRYGLETEEEISHFMKTLLALVKGQILVTPSQNMREFYYVGKRYFVTTPYAALQDIPAIKPWLLHEDKTWFRTQGLAIFSSSKKC